MIPSNVKVNPRVRELAYQAKMMADLLRAHEAFLKGIAEHRGTADEIKQYTQDVRNAFSRINQLPPGKPGYTPQKGKDYFTPTERQEIIDEVHSRIKDPEDGKDAEITPEHLSLIADLVVPKIPKPKDGVSPELDYEKLGQEVLANIKEKKLLKQTDIVGLDETVRAFSNQLAGKIYGKDTLVRGGGMTMSAGQNITLVPQADGTVKINASGGGSGTNVVTQYQLTAVQSGSDVTIDLTQLTHWTTFAGLIAVYRNNVMQTETLQFTFISPTVTIFNADATEIYNITYGYS